MHPQPDINSLSFLIGTWKTNGNIKDGNVTISGTDSYEWILDNKLILHKVDVKMGADHVEAIEMISVEGNDYKLRSFDNAGGFAEMRASLDEHGVLHIVGDKMRAQLTINNPKSMTAHWEKSEDNKVWTHWMDIELSKYYRQTNS